MGIDLKAGGRKKNTNRTQPKTENVYIRLLVKLYKFLSRRTSSIFNKVILKRLIMSKHNRPVISINRIVRYTKATEKEGRIIVVVGTVTDDARVVVPKMKICALRLSDTVRARILAAGGEIITFDQLALQRPTGSNTTLLRGRRTARECYRYFGAAGTPKSSTAPKVAHKGRKFCSARGARPSNGFAN